MKNLKSEYCPKCGNEIFHTEHTICFCGWEGDQIIDEKSATRLKRKLKLEKINGKNNRS